MSYLELTLGLAAWIVASGFVLAVAYLLQRRLRGERPALNSLGFQGLIVFVIATVVLLAGLEGALRAGALAGASLLGLVVLAAHPGTRSELAPARVDANDFAARMQSRGVRYLFVASEHSDDAKIGGLRECANQGEYLLERGRELYVLPG